MREFILSKYNVFKIFDQSVVGVNLNNKMLFKLTHDKYEKLMRHSDDLGGLEREDSVFFRTMNKLGIIQELRADNEYRNNLILENRLIVFGTNSYKLTINPTLNCNFNCWYCYETRTKKRMSKETIQSVLKFIENTIHNYRLSRFTLDWFGGEPLLCYENIMKPISEEVKKMCADKNVQFESGITTNGYLISENMISFFEENNMQSFQITLDGKQETHDKIRFLGNESGSYNKIVKNICMLANRLAQKNLSLRINFTRDSFGEIEKIIDSFPSEVRSKITVLFQQVWQDKNKEQITINELEELKLEFESAGFKVEKNILNLRGYTCYADLYNQAVVNYDGRVFKCTARNFEKEVEDGILTIDGDIIWTKSLAHKICKSTFDNSKCLNCCYLPVCFGPCSQKLSVIKDPKDFEKYCLKGGIERTFDYIMIEFEKSGKNLAPIFEYR